MVDGRCGVLGEVQNCAVMLHCASLSAGWFQGVSWRQEALVLGATLRFNVFSCLDGGFESTRFHVTRKRSMWRKSFAYPLHDLCVS